MKKIDKKLYILFVIFFLPACFHSTSIIHTIDSLTQAKSDLDSADQNTLVVFDVDDTLIEPAEKVYQTRFAHDQITKKLKNTLKGRTARSQDPTKTHELIATTRLLRHTWQLVETNALSIIKKLQAQQVKIIAVTNVPTGPCGAIPNMQEWRFTQLKNLGIDFSTSFITQEIVFKELAPFTGLLTSPSYPSGSKRFTMYYKGILCSLPHPKGIALAAFLKRINWKPQKIIVFDDVATYVTSVTQEMKKLNIPCSGYIYKGASIPAGTLDAQVAKKQFEALTNKI